MPGVHLTIAERLMWLELAKSPGYLVPKWRLAQYCENENVLRQYMTFLRHKTGRIIRNVRGEGYVLEREGAVLALRPRAASVRGPRRSRAPSPEPIPPCSATR